MERPTLQAMLSNAIRATRKSASLFRQVAVEALRQGAEDKAVEEVRSIEEQVMPRIRPVTADPRDISLGPLRFAMSGKAGEIQTATVGLQSYFRGHRFVATDTSEVPGGGTEISSITIGQKNVLPYVNQTGVPTFVFSEEANDNELGWPTCQPAFTASVQVKFLTDCSWSGEVYGMSVPDQMPEAPSRPVGSDPEALEDVKGTLRALGVPATPFLTHLAEPILSRVPLPIVKKRRWLVPFEIAGKAGEVLDAESFPQCPFRGEKLIAMDAPDGSGKKTEVVGMFVEGNKQTPTLRVKIPTSSFAYNRRDNRMRFTTCRPAGSLTFAVRFLEDAVWRGFLFGDAVL